LEGVQGYTPSTHNYNNYKQVRNKVTTMIREDREKYQKSLISNFKNNPKRFYGYLRNMQTVKSTVLCHLQVGDGSLTDSDKEAADTLCKSFHKVFTSDDA